MFKGTQDNNDWLKRTGSHATRPFANGRIDDLPPWAREPEEYYQSIKKQWDSILEQLHLARERVHDAKIRMRSSLPKIEYERINFKYEHDKRILLELEEKSKDYRMIARAAAKNSFGIVYKFCADRILDHETKTKLENEVQELLGRGETDRIEKGKEDLTKEQIHRIGLKTNRANKFKRYCDNKKGDRKTLVWSDEQGGRLSTPLRNSKPEN